jgi:hypothetical protein
LKISKNAIRNDFTLFRRGKQAQGPYQGVAVKRIGAIRRKSPVRETDLMMARLSSSHSANRDGILPKEAGETSGFTIRGALGPSLSP